MQDQVIETTAHEDNKVVGDADSYFNVQLLGRLQMDCDYYLGHGGRAKKHLWAGDEAAQIQKMKELYAAFTVKPQFMTMEIIEWYEKQMVHGQAAPEISAVRTLSVMSIAGLDARVLLAKARVAESIYGKDSEESGLLLLDAVQEAESDGRQAYDKDQSLPGMFEDEPELIQAWHNGYAASAEMVQMASCTGCKNAAGDPCPSHG